MAIVRPFRALRYQQGPQADLTALLAPPYDVISPEMQQELYARDPYNVIRLEYGTVSDADTANDNRYTRARATLADWLRDGTLAMEAAPSLYPLQERFRYHEQNCMRSGFFAAVRLQPFDQGDVLPHEWTLKGPKEDRLKLMRACQASFSPVFGLFDGRNTAIGESLAQVMASTPLARACGHGFDETLWRSDDAALCAGITDALSARQILIADGHHRYETMLALRDLLRAEYPDAPEHAAFNYVFMLLVDIHDPGLLVLPTHRLLLLTPEIDAAFCRVAGAQFQLEKITVAHPAQVTEILARRRDTHAFIWYANGAYTLLTSPKTTRDGLPVLDVMVLQERLIAPLFALDPAGEMNIERNVRYTIDPADAVTRVDRGDAASAVFLNSTPVPEVLTLAAAGVRLPQKSTYFYPKVPTGLVMHNVRPEVTVG